VNKTNIDSYFAENVKKADVAQEIVKTDEKKQRNYQQNYNNDQHNRTPTNNRETAAQNNPQTRKQGFTNYDYTKTSNQRNSKPHSQGQ
jgi:hypothetical protein